MSYLWQCFPRDDVTNSLKRKSLYSLIQFVIGVIKGTKADGRAGWDGVPGALFFVNGLNNHHLPERRGDHQSITM